MVPTLLVVLLLLPPFFLLVKRIKLKSISRKIHLLPSPPRFPFIGNLHQLSSLPHRSLFELSKKHGPLMLLQLGSIPTLVVSSPSSAREIMRTHDLVFASRPSLKASRILLYNNSDIAFASYGDYWRQIRKICVTNLLCLKQVQFFSHVRLEEVSLMIEKIARIASTSNGVVCMTEILNSLTCGVLCNSVLGSSMTEERRKLLCGLIRKNTVLFVQLFFEDYFPRLRWLDVLFGSEGKLRKHSQKWDSLLGEFIEEHVRRLKEGENTSSSDFIDVMLQLKNDTGTAFVLTNEQIKAILLDMIAAGTDTSFAVLDWSMVELIRNPLVMKKVQDEVRGIAHGEERVREEHLGKLSYLKAVIKEVLRLHPPIPLLLPRESLQDCQILEYNIPKETRVLINAWAIGRDEVYWKEPHEFKPERFLSGDVDYKGNDFHYIPFGAGRRICPGILFAISIVELALANLFFRFDWKLPSGISCESIIMDDSMGLTTTRREKLDLVPLDVHIT
ncbi:cytochrome P450 71A1-like [Dendrobium catenatum]|uniref:cytochrome P450 71A1-like n=1 Tax=Dendrobium catenatum TaxID=906689 RepID=UPI0009F522AD|nr:cytochrome P450 71A1-like [Dendrobium catenatum]